MYLLLKLNEWLTTNFREASFAFMEWNVHFCSRRIQDRIEGYQHLPDWKQTALKDFKFWLEDLPDASSEGEASMDSCDLYTVLSEFSALRGEIRIQNREQHKAIGTLDSFIGSYQEAWDVFKDRSEGIATLEERIREASEKRAVKPFLDVRDALIRGRDAGMELREAASDMASRSKGFFRSSPKGFDDITDAISGIIEGYEMAVRRFDRALDLVSIHPVETTGQFFDSATMKAVGRRSIPDMEEGMIVTENLTGFVRGDEVIRTAEVVVSARAVAQIVVNE